MIKEKITYIDYRGKERTEEFRFNLNEAEVIEMMAVSEEDLTEKFRRIAEKKDANEIMATFKDLLFRSYGEIDEDGRHFVKSKELSTAFFQTEAYNKMFMRLITEPDYAAAFIAGVFPEKKETK